MKHYDIKIRTEKEVEEIIRNACGRMKDIEQNIDKGASINVLTYEYDNEKRNQKLQEVEELKQVNDFILEHKRDYVFMEDRPIEQPTKEDLFRKNVTDKYQGLLDKVRKEEHINRKNAKYKKFRNDLQTIQIIREV